MKLSFHLRLEAGSEANRAAAGGEEIAAEVEIERDEAGIVRAFLYALEAFIGWQCVEFGIGIAEIKLDAPRISAMVEQMVLVAKQRIWVIAGHGDGAIGFGGGVFAEEIGGGGEENGDGGDAFDRDGCAVGDDASAFGNSADDGVVAHAFAFIDASAQGDGVVAGGFAVAVDFAGEGDAAAEFVRAMCFKADDQNPDQARSRKPSRMYRVSPMR